MQRTAVQTAVDTLQRHGQRVSVRNVHRLTGGSFRDIAHLLRQLDTETPDAQPAALSEAWQPMRDREQLGALILLMWHSHVTVRQHRNHRDLFLVQSADGAP